MFCARFVDALTQVEDRGPPRVFKPHPPPPETTVSPLVQVRAGVWHSFAWAKAGGAFGNPQSDYAFDQKPAFEAKVE